MSLCGHVLQKNNAVLGVLLVFLLANHWLGIQVDKNCDRKRFQSFPKTIHGWVAEDSPVDPNDLKDLGLSDYLSLEYAASKGRSSVSLWVAYYERQKPGTSIHSPKACLLGGGWEMSKKRVVAIGQTTPGGHQLSVNRAVIRIGPQKALIYYWYRIGADFVSNEFVLKYAIFWNKLRKSRTDGALVRLITPIAPLEGEAAADARLQSFARELLPALQSYLPDC
jgi:EpsI family protein